MNKLIGMIYAAKVYLYGVAPWFILVGLLSTFFFHV